MQIFLVTGFSHLSSANLAGSLDSGAGEEENSAPPPTQGISRRMLGWVPWMQIQGLHREGEAAGTARPQKVSDVREGMAAFLASASCSSHPTPAGGASLGRDFPREV